MKTLSFALNLHIKNQAPSFHKLYKHMYGGDSFSVYRRSFRNGEESITIWRSSVKCYRVLRTSNIIHVTSDICYETFSTIEALCKYLKLITC